MSFDQKYLNFTTLNTNKMMAIILLPMFFLFPLSIYIRLETDIYWIGVVGAIAFIICPLVFIPLIKKKLKTQLSFGFEDEKLVIKTLLDSKQLSNVEVSYFDLKTIAFPTTGSISLRFINRKKLTYEFYPHIINEKHVIELLGQKLIEKCKEVKHNKIIMERPFMLTNYGLAVYIFLTILVCISLFFRLSNFYKSLFPILPALILYMRFSQQRKESLKIYEKLKIKMGV